jgi:hypothetical protein
MNDLDEAGRAMLALAGDAHDPTDADRARVRAALAGRLGAAAGLGVGTVVVLGATAKTAAGAGGIASTGGAGAAGAAAGIGSTLAMKLVGVAVAITTAAGVGAAVKLARRSAQAPAAAKSAEMHGPRMVVAAALPPLTAPATAPEQSTSKKLSSATPASDPTPSHAAPSYAGRNHPAPSLTTPAAAPAQIDTPDRTGTVPHRRSVTVATASDHACPPATYGANPAAHRSESAVADEARLVHDGVRARRAGQPACALSLLDAHARTYPEGVLAQEREAERALALADLGRIPEARLAATAFLRKHPASPLGVRLRHHIPGLDIADESR